jgi:hypothetical protein
MSGGDHTVLFGLAGGQKGIPRCRHANCIFVGRNRSTPRPQGCCYVRLNATAFPEAAVYVTGNELLQA